MVRGAADDGRGESLEKGEKGSEGAAEEDNIVFRIDGYRERLFVRVQVEEDAVQE